MDTLQKEDTLVLRLYYNVTGIWPAQGCVRIDTIGIGIVPKEINAITLQPYAISHSDTLQGTGDTTLLKSLGISSAKKHRPFTITPNPASSLLRISDITGITALKLTDIQGRIIRSYAKPVVNIDVSMLASGMYLLQLQTAEGIYTHKFVKE